jgi:hypothetical protein
MLQGPELLNLTVKDVQLPNGTIRSIMGLREVVWVDFTPKRGGNARG